MCNDLKGDIFLNQKQKFKYAEKCLYEYKRNLACLNVLYDDLKIAKASVDVKAQSYQQNLASGDNVSDPVSSRVIKIEELEERIRYLERLTKPITALIEDLNSPDVLNGSYKTSLMEIVRLFYFGQNVLEVILKELNLTRRTFFRLRRELIYLAICYLAL